jgi:hypothetical protein
MKTVTFSMDLVIGYSQKQAASMASAIEAFAIVRELPSIAKSLTRAIPFCSPSRTRSSVAEAKKRA